MGGLDIWAWWVGSLRPHTGLLPNPTAATVRGGPALAPVTDVNSHTPQLVTQTVRLREVPRSPRLLTLVHQLLYVRAIGPLLLPLVVVVMVVVLLQVVVV